MSVLTAVGIIAIAFLFGISIGIFVYLKFIRKK